MVQQIITIKLRLCDKHTVELNRQARTVNFVWNYCNEISNKAWRDHHRWLSKFDLQRLTAGASTELDIHAHTIQRTCRAFTYARDAKRRSRVRWRSRKSLGWVPFNKGHVTFDGSTFKFRGAVYSTMHLSPRLSAGVKIGAGSFNADARGRWYINLPIKVECADMATDRHVGIDLGLKDLATLSTGEKIKTPKFYRKSEALLAQVQRAKKTKHALRIHAKITNRRKDFLHKASAKIVKEFGLIIVGDVSPSKLTQTSMAKSVLDAGWSDFKRMLSYKAIMHGGSVIEVSERLTSQTCSCCGSMPSSRPKGIAGLGIREWRCSDCGTVHDRDVNAARNILRIGQDALVEGAL